MSALSAEPGGRLLTRSQAAEVVGTSVSTWRRHIEGRLINGIKNGNKNLFVEADVVRVRGQVTAHLRHESAADEPSVTRESYSEILDALDSGKNVVDIARNLGLFIGEVEPVQREWLRHRRSIYLDNDQIDKVWKVIEHHYGPERQPKHESADGFLKFLERLAQEASLQESTRACTSCPQDVIRKAVYCATCADDRSRSSRSRRRAS